MKKMANIMVISLLALLVVVGARCLASVIPTPEFMSASLKNQITASGPALQADYIIGRFGEQTPVANQVRWKVHYIRTADVAIMDETTEHYSAVKGEWKPTSNTKHRYDIVTAEYKTLEMDTLNKRTVGSISHGISGSRFAMYNVLETAAYPILGRLLYDALLRGAVVKGKETIDGCDCWQVEFTGKPFGTTSATCLAWLDPAIGFCPRKIQIAPIATPTLPLITVHLKQYADIGNSVWFPREMTVQGVKADGSSLTMLVSLSKVNIGNTPSEAELSVKFPPGTRVVLRPDNTIITVP